MTNKIVDKFFIDNLIFNENKIGLFSLGLSVSNFRVGFRILKNSTYLYRFPFYWEVKLKEKTYLKYFVRKILCQGKNPKLWVSSHFHIYTDDTVILG